MQAPELRSRFNLQPVQHGTIFWANFLSCYKRCSAEEQDERGGARYVVVLFNPAAPSLLWLENDGKMQFTMHPIASSPTHLLTLAVGDLDGDGKPDAVTGGDAHQPPARPHRANHRVV